MSATEEWGEVVPFWKDTPAEVGYALRAWNEMVRDLTEATATWGEPGTVDYARQFDGLDLEDTARTVYRAVAAMYLLPGMPERQITRHENSIDTASFDDSGPTTVA